MALAFIGLGSNRGEGKKNLLEAWRRLGSGPGLTPIAISSPYRTSPVAKPGLAPLADVPFTNAVGAITTGLAPEELLRRLLAVEKEMGRDRGQGPDRTIDLDLLYYDETCLATPDLTLPHPEIPRRLFVLLPLCEIAPDHVHPGNGRSSRRMLRELDPADQRAEKLSWHDAVEDI